MERCLLVMPPCKHAIYTHTMWDFIARNGIIALFMKMVRLFNDFFHSLSSIRPLFPQKDNRQKWIFHFIVCSNILAHLECLPSRKALLFSKNEFMAAIQKVIRCDLTSVFTRVISEFNRFQLTNYFVTENAVSFLSSTAKTVSDTWI